MCVSANTCVLQLLRRLLAGPQCSNKHMCFCCSLFQLHLKVQLTFHRAESPDLWDNEHEVSGLKVKSLKKQIEDTCTVCVCTVCVFFLINSRGESLKLLPGTASLKSSLSKFVSFSSHIHSFCHTSFSPAVFGI